MPLVTYRTLNRLRRCVPIWRSGLGWLSDAEVGRIRETGYLFIHVPKTGGSSVSEYLYGMAMPHRLARDIRFYHPSLFRRSCSFAVIRDPVDRFLSAFDYLTAGGLLPQDREFAAKYVTPFPDVGSFVEALEGRSFRTSVLKWLHFRPQADFLCRRGDCLVDHLIAFEELASAVQRLVRGIAPFPKLNVTPGPRSPADALGVRGLALVGEIYAQDAWLRRRVHVQKLPKCGF
jgi:hypothetical protein